MDLSFETVQYLPTRVGTSASDIRASGLRCTAQRIAVLEILRSRRHHYRADELSGLVAARLGAVSTQAVYNALGALVTVGLARRIEPAGSAALFEAGSGDNHHHLVCRDCGVVVDVECLVGPAPCVEIADGQGFVVDEAEITFWGWCPECVAGAPVSLGTGDGERDNRGSTAVARAGGTRGQRASFEMNNETPGGIGGRHRQ